MLYVGYPKLTPAERLAHLPNLPEACCAELPAAWSDEPLHQLRLTSLGGQPYYLLDLVDGRRVALHAQNGKVLDGADAAMALDGARQFAGEVGLRYLGAMHEDAWTHSRSLDRDRPLHRVEVDDASRTLLYLSGRTGEVVLDASLNERRWNWVGAWLHWLYPFRGGLGIENGWRLIVIALSLAGTLMAVLGMVIGLLRWRFGKPYRSGSRSPYLGGHQRWHHIGGLLFGTILVLWVFSGLMSMRPWGVTDGRSALDLKSWQSGPLRAGDMHPPVTQVLSAMRTAGLDTVEVTWQRMAGTTYLIARDEVGNSRILEHADQLEPVRQFSQERLLQTANAMAPGTTISHDWQEAFDFYYLQRAQQSMYGNQHRPLPVLRVRFDDAAQTWVYIDPASGQIVAHHDSRLRAGRWLFNLLHSWDWPPLLQRPRLREALIIAFSVGGLVVCMSGVVLGWRRLNARSR